MIVWVWNFHFYEIDLDLLWTRCKLYYYLWCESTSYIYPHGADMMLRSSKVVGLTELETSKASRRVSGKEKILGGETKEADHKLASGSLPKQGRSLASCLYNYIILRGQKLCIDPIDTRLVKIKYSRPAIIPQ